MRFSKFLKEVDPVVSLIYQGAIEPTPWQALLRHLRLRVGCSVAAMSIRIRRGDTSPINIWDRNRLVTDEELRLARLGASLHGHLDPLTNALKKPGDIYTLDEVLSPGERAQNGYYKTVIAPFRIERQIAMHIAEPSGWRSNVGFMNSSSSKDFGAEHKAFLRALRPHLERALEIHARIKRGESEKAAFEEALDRLAIGAYILDADGRVLDVNDTGRNIAGQHDGLAMVKDRLVLSPSRDHRRLDDAIKRAVSAQELGEADDFAEVIRVERTERRPLSILVRAVRDTDRFRNYVSPSAIVYACDSAQSAATPEQFVAEIFGLSATEARLATMLASGLTLEQAAGKLGITENTVRSYAKRTFGKAGVTRQAELVRLILTSVAPLARSAEHPR